MQNVRSRVRLIRLGIFFSHFSDLDNFFIFFIFIFFKQKNKMEVNSEMPSSSVAEMVSNMVPKSKKDEGLPVNVAALDPGVCLFSPVKVDVGTKREYTELYYPISSLANDKCVEFGIFQTSTLYFSLQKCVLRLKLKIVTNDGSSVKPTDLVGYVNSPLNSIWRNIDVLIQQQPMSPGIGYNIAYKGIIDQLVYTPTTHLNSVGATEGFYYDTAGYHDKLEFADSGVNKGLLERFQFTKDGNEMWVEGPLAHDFFSLKNYLPSGIAVLIRLYPHSPAFPLLNAMETDTYKIEVTDAVLAMRVVEPTSSTITAHNQILADHPGIFHYDRSIIRCYTVPVNVSTWAIHQVFTDEIPHEVVVAVLDSDRYLGGEKLNPFLFGTHNVNFISFAAEGYHTITYVMDFAKHQYANVYRALYEVDDGRISPGGAISYTDFPKGYVLYRFRLAPLSNERSSRLKYGNTTLTLTFSSPTTKSLTILAYGRVKDYFTVDLTRNIRMVPSDKF